MNISPVGWVVFNAFIALMLLFDLRIVQRSTRTTHYRTAALWSLIWIALALLFNAVVYLSAGPRAGLEFLAGYLVEKSLSLDNIFVFTVIFGSFQVPLQHQHRVLFWGVAGALVMRGLFIAVGTLALERWHWVVYILGALLLVTAVRTLRGHVGNRDIAQSRIVRLVQATLPMTREYHGNRLFVRVDGRLLATPLLLVLIVVELTDVLFAVDSIPAVLAITTDPFIVYTSNAFAILGLRSLYLLLAAAIPRIRNVKYGLAAMLGLVGSKMILMDVYEIPTLISLVVIAVLAALAVVTSLRRRPKHSMRAGAGTPAIASCATAESAVSSTRARPHVSDDTPSQPEDGSDRDAQQERQRQRRKQRAPNRSEVGPLEE